MKSFFHLEEPEAAEWILSLCDCPPEIAEGDDMRDSDHRDAGCKAMVVFDAINRWVENEAANAAKGEK